MTPARSITPDQALETSKDPVARWLLLAALVLGLTRFVRLGEWSLWLDEALTLADSLAADPGGLKNPLGYGLFRVFFDLLEHRPSEWELRLLPAIFGWLGIALTYWAFAPFAGRRVAAGAALLVAASSWHAYWSQMARFYTLTQDLSLLGCGLVLRGLWKESSLRVGLGIVVASAASLAHYSGAFPIPAIIGLPFLLRTVGVELPGSRSKASKLLLVVGVIGVLAAAPRLFDVWRIWTAIHGGGSVQHLVLTTGFFITPLLGIGAVVGAYFALTGKKPFEQFAVAVAAVVLLEAILASYFVRVSAQYVFVLLPWVALIAALPIGAYRARDADASSPSAPDRRGVRLSVAYLALLVLPAVATLGLYLSARQGERPAWRDAYRFVYSHKEADDLIMGMDAPVGEYYLAPGSVDLRNQTQLVYLDDFRAHLPDHWARFDRRIWFVLNLEQLEDWEPGRANRFRATLAQHCRLVASYPLIVESRDLSVYVYLRE